MGALAPIPVNITPLQPTPTTPISLEFAEPEPVLPGEEVANSGEPASDSQENEGSKEGFVQEKEAATDIARAPAGSPEQASEKLHLDYAAGPQLREHISRRQELALEARDRDGLVAGACVPQSPGSPTPLARVKLSELGNMWGAKIGSGIAPKHMESFSFTSRLDSYRAGEVWGRASGDGGYWVYQLNGGVGEFRRPELNAQLPSSGLNGSTAPNILGSNMSLFKGSLVPFTWCGGKILSDGQTEFICGKFDVASFNFGINSTGFNIGFSGPKLTGQIEYLNAPSISNGWITSSGYREEASLGLFNFGGRSDADGFNYAEGVIGAGFERRRLSMPANGLTAEDIRDIKCQAK
jgi:hypothetical protein